MPAAAQRGIAARDRGVAALRHLAERPAALFAMLWAANAIRFPYGSLIHDARLYALQVQNQVSGGAFASDLFLKYGSQDQFTPFSRLAAPAVAVFGIDWTFFVLFVVFNALLLLALQRLVLSLIDDRAIAVAALITIALSPLPFGGLGIFRVSEYFFTPRLMACALAVFAVERTVRGRHLAALALAAIATVIHPLMGFGAVEIGLACALIEWLPRRMLLPAIAAAVVVGAAILGYRPLGTAVFGTFDADWLDIVRRSSAYNFPGFWTRRDWINVAVSIAIPVWAAAAMSRESPSRARFFYICAALGTIGVATMIVAGTAPYRVLLQGQPYRIMWILSVLLIPLAFWLAARLWTTGPVGQVAAACVVAVSEAMILGTVDLVLSLLGVGLFLLILTNARPPRSLSESIGPSVAGGITFGLVATSLIRLYRVGIRVPMLVTVVGLKTTADVFLNAPGSLVMAGVALLVLTVLGGRHRPGRGFIAGAVAIALSAHAVAFTVPRLPAFREMATPYGRDLPFLQTYFRERPHAANVPPSVYEGIWESTTLLWFDLQSTVYFNLEQLSGVVFNRETAIEGRRRAAVVQPFELQRYQAVASFIPWGDTLMIRNLFGTDAVPPTRADLVRLCGADEPIDVAILSNDFGDLASASNGRLFVYECARVRAANRE